jgi:hypothetical protein
MRFSNPGPWPGPRIRRQVAQGYRAISDRWNLGRGGERVQPFAKVKSLRHETHSQRGGSPSGGSQSPAPELLPAMSGRYRVYVR